MILLCYLSDLKLNCLILLSLPQDSFQVSLGLKILCGSSLLFSSGCLFSSGLACGMGEILEDQRMDLDLEDEIVSVCRVYFIEVKHNMDK